ncbi:YitT family protein [Barnesiella viscericola]|uniref:YitT family protein n=1 Tax=Barnesiella viscericola TaxID=397865 RepID=A0A921MQH8_9BACT|nr:YitT family protein [Barnesiella viscericola]HJG88246.1 YitT family protein [Barnesiella viscericola]
MRLPFNSVLYAVKDYMVIIFGLLLYALGWVGFLLPNEITTGGVTGIAALIYYGTKIPVSASYFTINVVLLLAAIKILGLKFFVRTIFSVFMCSFFLGILPEFIPHSLVEEQPFMSAIIGGILCGVGVGLVFVSNGSTGGTDIIAAIVNKYKNISFAKMMMYIDFLIIASSYVLFHSMEKMIFGYVVMGVMSYTMDMVINGKRQSVQILILSDKYEEIATHVNQDIHRGVTVLDGMGWYSKQPKKVLMILAKRNESVKIFRLIKSIDPKAFISQSNVVGVYGEGFDKIKT